MSCPLLPDGNAGEAFNKLTAPVSSKHPIGRIDLCINHT
jgi:hypothetical protein